MFPVRPVAITKVSKTFFSATIPETRSFRCTRSVQVPCVRCYTREVVRGVPIRTCRTETCSHNEESMCNEIRRSSLKVIADIHVPSELLAQRAVFDACSQTAANLAAVAFSRTLGGVTNLNYDKMSRAIVQSSTEYQNQLQLCLRKAFTRQIRMMHYINQIRVFASYELNPISNWERLT